MSSLILKEKVGLSVTLDRFREWLSKPKAYEGQAKYKKGDQPHNIKASTPNITFIRSCLLVLYLQLNPTSAAPQVRSKKSAFSVALSGKG